MITSFEWLNIYRSKISHHIYNYNANYPNNPKITKITQKYPNNPIITQNTQKFFLIFLYFSSKWNFYRKISFSDFLSIRQKLVRKKWGNDIYICSWKDGLQIYISFLHCSRTNFCLVVQKKPLYFPILDFQNILHI